METSEIEERLMSLKERIKRKALTDPQQEGGLKVVVQLFDDGNATVNLWDFNIKEKMSCGAYPTFIFPTYSTYEITRLIPNYDPEKDWDEEEFMDYLRNSEEFDEKIVNEIKNQAKHQR